MIRNLSIRRSAGNHQQPSPFNDLRLLCLANQYEPVGLLQKSQPGPRPQIVRFAHILGDYQPPGCVDGN